MQILVSNLKKDKPISIKGSNLDNWVYEELNDLNFKINSLKFSLDFNKKGDFIEVDGLIEGTFLLTCVRCLENMPYSIEDKFKLFIYREDQKIQSDHEISLNTNDLDFIFLETNEIYPAKLIREQIILSLPDYPVCNENNAECHCKCKKNSIIKDANLN